MPRPSIIGTGDDRVSDGPKSDPKEEAERRLRLMLAAEARRQHDQLGMIQKGFYGCVGLIVFLFLVLLFFF
jgi:hypothetical protein